LRRVCERALDTLEDAADKAMMTTAVAALNRCVAGAHTNAARTCVSLLSLGSLPGIVYSVCMQTALSGLVYGTAMSQLRGIKELGDWETVIDVSAPAVLPSMQLATV
jgi:hypothetical protein